MNTWIYLSDFPKNIHEHRTINFNKALEVFVKYILIPLVLLYLIILYVYGIKILVEWELPKGWVSYLVTALAILGFIVQIIINPVQKAMKSLTIRLFHPYFYIMLLPLVVLLFVAIYRRITDYGITENRYFVVALAFWILGMSLYLLIAKNRRLIVLPISLFLLALLTSFGYWSAMSVAMRSQVAQFEQVFKTVKSHDNIVSSNQYKQLESILDYMYDRRALSKLDPITGLAMENFVDTTGNKRYGSRRLATRPVLDSLHIKRPPNDLNSNTYYNKPYSYHTNEDYFEQGFPIEAFDYFAPFLWNSHREKSMRMRNILVRYDKKRDAFSFTDRLDSTKIFELPLREKMLELAKYNSRLPKEAMGKLTMDFENERILGKLIFSNLSYSIKNDSITMDNLKAYLFLKQR